MPITMIVLWPGTGGWKTHFGGGEPPGLAAHELEEEVVELHAISADEPNTFAEVEYIAASMAATQGDWLARLMEELIGREDDPPMLYVDSKATISLIKNPVLHD